MAITTVSVADHLTLVQGTKGSSMHGISTQHSILSLSLSRSPREAWLAMLLLAASAHAQTGYSTMGLIKKDDSHAVDAFKDWTAREQFLSGDAKRASVKLRREWWDLVSAGKCNWTLASMLAWFGT